MSNTPGINIEVPEKAPSFGPIPLHATMVADMQTFNANNGILDKALDIALVRRDAPGLQFVAKLDPHVWMEPETPLPPPPPGTDLDNAGFIQEEREFDVLDFGAEHDGAADYYVLASFAGWISQPAPLDVENESHSLVASEAMPAPPLTSDEKITVPSPPDIPGIVVQINEGGLTRIEGGLRLPIKPAKFPDEEASEPFVTIIAVRLAPNGGMSGGSFFVDADFEGMDHVAQFLVPLSFLSPKPDTGNYRVFVFSGDEYAEPLEVEVPDNG